MKKNSVLVVYSGWLGDLVWIIPSLHALKTVFNSVSLVVSEVQAPLAEIMLNGLVDAVYVDIPAHRMAAARKVRRAALDKGIETYIDLKGRGKTGLYMPWGRGLKILIPHRKDAREYALARLVHPAAGCMPERSQGHMVEAYLSGLRGLDILDTPVSFALPFSEQTLNAAEELVEQEGLRGDRCVALSPGSAQFSKIWPAENYRRLAEILINDLGCRVVLMGGRDFAPNDDYDLKISRKYFSAGNIVNLVERTGLDVDSCLLSSGVFAVSVGNDSFANHMAGSAGETAAGTPGALQADNGRWYKANRTVSLFAPTNPVFCRPYDPTGTFNTIVLPDQYPEECVYDRTAHVCPHYGDRFCVDRCHCMQNIPVEKVVAAVAQSLGI